MHASIRIVVLIAVASCSVHYAAGQKVKVNYDQSAEFSRYRTYSIQQPAASPAHSLLYAHIVGSIEQELNTRSLSRTEGEADLVVVLSGGVEYGLDSTDAAFASSGQPPMHDPREWPGKSAPPGVGGKPMPSGVLEVNFVDRVANKVVWSGWVKQKLNPDKKSEALAKSDKAVQKLLQDFPPKRR